MLAVIKTGGKQYTVKKGDTIKVEKLLGKEGDAVSFDDVLMTGDEKAVTLGTPLVKGSKVEGKVLKQGKLKKVTGIKHKAKKRYKVKFGHRQNFTEVEITKVGK
jgi:large subunit ribosomal protein L21